MSDELNKLTRKRGSLKASLTIFSKFIDSIKSRQEQVLNDVDVIQLQDRVSRAEHLIQEFSELQNDIESVSEFQNLEDQYTERAKFEESFYSLIAIAKNILNKNVETECAVSSRSNRSLASASTNPGRNLNTVKLPIISLPKFQGTYDSWLEFRDTFESLIHNNNDLAEIQKFHYLRASLEGSAAQVIKSVEFTANSYTVAWDILCQRYNNTKLLVYNHVKSVFALENMHKESSSKIRKLVDDISKHLRSLEQLGQDISNWDTLLIFMISSKLDNQTLREWEKYTANTSDLPSFNDFKLFLRNRADFLETLEFKNNEKQTKPRDFRQTSRSLASRNLSCNYCKKNHSIYTCTEFLKLSVSNRLEFIRKSKLCENCLLEGHPARQCKMGHCRKCKFWHNTLLHQEVNNSSSNDCLVSRNPVNADEVAALTCELINRQTSQVFLSTACIQVIDKNGIPLRARALLDCGSQSSFISSRLFERLGLSKFYANLTVFGISNARSHIKNKCNIEIHSLYNSYKTNVTCFILPEITSVSPSFKVDVSAIKIPSEIYLADPEFNKPGPIDILLGADLFWNLLSSNRISCGKNQPTLQETQMGWIVSGPLSGTQVETTSCNLAINQDLHKLLTRFWEIEECEVAKPLSQEEIMCEEIFSKTTTRDASGRFIITLPLKQPADCLGESKSQAEKRFYIIERKLMKNESLRERYTEFLNEYKDLNHMSISNDESSQAVEYYMPHHGVLREASLTTKLRVVFDASAPSSNGLSLNNIQLIGPVLQEDLFSIILRFRKHTYVISSDIAKMYRQVLVNSDQRSLQKILWRSSPTENLQSFTLNTVTYGQASASFLAIRCLFELANDCEESHPDIAKIIRHDFYVDDMLTGADDIEQAQFICHKVSQVLQSGGFELRKWYSNNSEVLRHIDNPDSSCGILEFASDETAKTLGLSWSCQNDLLVYNINITSKDSKPTKRGVLSLTARIFDPLGLLAPCIILAKILLQKLWAAKISWDEPIPDYLETSWNKLKLDLPGLNKLIIKRHVLCELATTVDLHGFADASEQAYGACIYLRSVNQRGEVHINLLCAKSKVAPIKTISIPRLELCAALLLSRLAFKVIKSMHIKFNQCVLWSDSTITLAWIQTAPNLLKTFIANRVSEIQTLTSTYEWKYIPTHSNPADHVSRGLYPREIIISSLWWQGPHWLKMSPSEWPTMHYKIENLPELKTVLVSRPGTEVSDFPFERFSKYSRLIRVTTYLLRFKANTVTSKADRELGSLTTSELNYAVKCLVKISQSQTFPDELSKLVKGASIDAKSKLFSLTPFLDQDNIIRVGGRLKQSDFPFEKKHPIVLHSSHHFTRLLFEHEHNQLIHAGPQLLLSSIRNNYWPISGRNLARATVRKCMKCFRFKAETVQPIMGDLPRDRTIPLNPFLVTGVDYAGPFLTRDRKGCKLEKCYVSVFICFSTKAIHLELISSLSTNSFLQALRRFVSRRGKPSKIFSDNGTNFIGAKRELGKFLVKNEIDLVSVCANEQINWQFIPPYSPHFGGLWEAGVKSVKHHLRHVLANAHLLFEEFSTTLSQIEAILNSRPLSPLSSDPSDLCPLTPAHFLIGRVLTAVPDENVQDVQINRLSRYQLIQRICQHFWRRWTTEYIAELQQRLRWKKDRGQLSEGALVLIKDNYTLPTEWRLGRIIQLHKGDDGIARVASIQTINGIIKRSFPKICPLPVSS